ncbi:septation ring formation regulator EzrA [Candidatus Stoquefichus massiliensis]|uniref:septation ring formation regulator EzrA n=1 Tax=Candidatus Stoquefichus massiliensis TaxID=1470350 RepID=UPI000487E286|nr:septation ring formation regulator EzrA [Candidatus Stoquefichus massiliensis]
MDKVMEIIEKIGTRNLIFAGIGLIVLVILFLLYRGMRLRKYRKLIVEVENRMNAIKSLPLQYRLGRVHSISKNMPDVVEQYQEYAAEFERITDYQKNELAVLVNEVDEQLFYGKLRKVSKKMKELDDMLFTYEKDSQALLAQIETITEIENVQRIEIIRVKEKYRQTIDQFESIRFKVEEFVPSLLNIFNEIDDSFVKLEGMMNNQRFEEAQHYTKEIEERVDWIDQRLEDLPSYIAVVRQYIPKKINHIETLLEEMSQDDFSLNQLDVQGRFDVIKNTIEESIVHIKKLELDNMGEVLQSLVDSIDALIHDLETEKQSFVEFKEKWDACYTLITEIYDQYKQAMIDYNRMKNLYIIDIDHVEIDEKFHEFDKILRESYNLEEEMKKGDFSYSQMISKVEIMHNRAAAHQDNLDTFFAFRDNLYLQEQRAIDELENINIVLLEIKSEIKNKHLPMINESYKDYIQDSYDKAAQIQAYRMNRPVELAELSKRVDGARDVIYKLYDNVHNLIVTAEMVEEAIVFGNRYRSTFLEVNTELTKAEVLFRNGEYTKALSTAVDIIEKIQPGSYEELIKKSSEKSN